MTTFKEGDPVILIFGKDRWLVSATKKDFHCKLGRINLYEIIGKKPGDEIKSNKNKSLKIYVPTLNDIIRNVTHSSQIIYEKDAAMISFLANVQPGMTVYEAGMGSGSLTIILSRLVGSHGKVVTHEIRKEAFETGRKNVKKYGLDNVEFININVKEGFKEGKADALILDMGDPWEAIEQATKVLKVGGRIVVFLPTFNQLEKTKNELSNHGFFDIKTIELIEREIQISKNAVRPSTRMIGHTGFLMSGTYGNM